MKKVILIGLILIFSIESVHAWTLVVHNHSYSVLSIKPKKGWIKGSESFISGRAKTNIYGIGKWTSLRISKFNSSMNNFYNTTNFKIDLKGLEVTHIRISDYNDGKLIIKKIK